MRSNGEVEILSIPIRSPRINSHQLKLILLCLLLFNSNSIHAVTERITATDLIDTESSRQFLNYASVEAALVRASHTATQQNI